jgi:hypothetical protein
MGSHIFHQDQPEPINRADRFNLILAAVVIVAVICGILE